MKDTKIPVTLDWSVTKNITINRGRKSATVRIGRKPVMQRSLLFLGNPVAVCLRLYPNGTVRAFLDKPAKKRVIAIFTVVQCTQKFIEYQCGNSV